MFEFEAASSHSVKKNRNTNLTKQTKHLFLKEFKEKMDSDHYLYKLIKYEKTVH